MSWTQGCIIGIFLYLSLLPACHHVILVLPAPIPGNILGKVTFLVTFGIRLYPSAAFWALLLAMMVTPFLLSDSCPQ